MLKQQNPFVFLGVFGSFAFSSQAVPQFKLRLNSSGTVVLNRLDFKRKENQMSRIIATFFAQSKWLVGKPCYKKGGNNVVVNIPYFLPDGERLGDPKFSHWLTDKKINALGSVLTKLFHSHDGSKQTNNKIKLNTVEVRLMRLRYPYLDSYILAQYLSLNAGKYNFTRMQKGVINKVPIINATVIDHLQPSEFEANVNSSFAWIARISTRNEYRVEMPWFWIGSTSNEKSLTEKQAVCSGLNTNTAPLLSHIGGVKLELAGRLTTQRSIPRKTVDNTHTGSFRTTVSQSLKQTSSLRSSPIGFGQYSAKNKLGAFTMKVWISSVNSFH